MSNQQNFAPLVSIVIPVYNGSNYLEQAINSALAQTYPNVEILVINDGSRDNGATEAIAHRYGEKIRYLTKENGGVATALNMGIQNMRGEYFSWLSHDDMYKPKKLEHQIDALINMDPKTILYGGYDLLFVDKKETISVDFASTHSQYDMDEPLFPIFHGMANGCTMLIHRSQFDRVGLFNTQLPTTQDYDMWFRLFRGEKIHYCRTTDVVMRQHQEQDSKKIAGHGEEASQEWIARDRLITDAERVAIAGTPYLFYRDVLGEIQGAPYDAAIKYYTEQLENRKSRPFQYEKGMQDELISALICYCEKQRKVRLEQKERYENEIFQLKDQNEKMIAKILRNIKYLLKKT